MSDTQAITWWPWMNHSMDGFSGLTITVPAASGVLVISALTLLVRMSGEAAWKIMAYMLHHLRSSTDAEDALTRQLQVYLRNSGTAFGSALDLSMIGWAWKGRPHHGIRRTLGLAWLALSIALSFTAAGIFVGKVAVPAYQVNQILLKPTNCGLESTRANVAQSALPLYDVQAKHASDKRQARAYANACYNSLNTSAECSSLPVQQLPYTINRDASCPFSGRCRGDSGTTVQFDTGMLDSHQHLGINAQPDDRVGFRVSSTCSVVRAADLTRLVPDEHSNGNWSIMQVYFGPIPDTANYTASTATSLTPGLIAATIHLFPIADLALENADTSLMFFAANSIWYYAPNNDPMFSANGTYTQTLNDGTTFYLPDQWFNVLACADQIQLCNSATTACSTLTGNMVTGYNIQGLNKVQQATAERIILAQLQSHMYDVVNGPGASVLQASDKLINLFSPQLPDDQWIIETTQMFQTALANIQLRIADFPVNKWYTNETQNVVVLAPSAWQEDDAAEMEQLCRRQRVMSTDQYQSFSLAGVLLVVVLGPALILTSWFLDLCVQKRHNLQPEGSKRFRRLAWIADGKLQLLRLALKNAGYDDWEKELDTVPVRVTRDKDIQPPVEEDNAVLYRKTVSQQVLHAHKMHEMEPLFCRTAEVA